MPELNRTFRQRVMGIRKRVRTTLSQFRKHCRDLWRGETDSTFYDLYDLAKINTLLKAYKQVPLSTDAAQVVSCPVGAARWIVANLLSQPSWRRRFPEALSNSASFEHWLTTVELPRLKLPGIAGENVRQAIASRPDTEARLCWALRVDLREAFPLGITPHPNRGQYLEWLISYGSGDFGLTPERSLWFLIQEDETPDRGLLTSYAFHPSWQEAVPEGSTSVGWSKLTHYLKQRYNLGSRWFRLAQPRFNLRPVDEVRTLQACTDSVPAPNPQAILRWLGEQPEWDRPTKQWIQHLNEDLASGFMKKPGVNIHAHFGYPSGLQEAALSLAEALETTGWRIARRDIPTSLNSHYYPDRVPNLELFDTTIQVTAVNTFPQEALPRTGLAMRAGVHRIGVWYWELEELPTEWLDRLNCMNEVWAPTSFLVQTFKKYLQVPVKAMLPGLQLPSFKPQPRSLFQLPEDRFLFYFSFDMGSVMERKNPLSLIQAFQRAFRKDDAVHLAIKVSRGQANPENFARLRSVAQQAGVTIINEVLTRSNTLALLNQADCYVSMHRSEGLGLGLAESMLLGKPVIATGYSGNLDFMTRQTSHLIETTRVPIEQDATASNPYPKGCVWGNPSIEHAAELMRHVFENPDDSKQMGQRAKADLQERLSVKAYGERLNQALRK